jgi:thiol-disulfide isomerase/thioredoxin
VELVPVTFDEMLARIAANKKAKLTLVDAWATWCGPCKENFPHVVEMHKKYAGKGLAVVSLSMDDREKPKQVDEALAFLKEKKAVFTNFLLDEDFGVGFEKLDVGAIPAVFLFGPDGKEVKRFTMDDTENQFTYEEVEKVVAALLEGKPIPK